MDWYTQYCIQTLKEDIFKCERLEEIGLELYGDNKDTETLHATIYWSGEKDRLIKVLNENYGINYKVN